MRASEERPSRRDQAITHAAALLREGGPQALTSVAVAERLGVTQSAVYRHVRNMDELSTLAAEVVIQELNDALAAILLDPSIDWEALDDLGAVCRAIITQVVNNDQAFIVVDQWRFAGGALGAGIGRVVDDAVDMIADLLEARWRIEFGYEPQLEPTERMAVRGHANAFHDDGHALARIARTLPPALDLDAVAKMMEYRIIAGWASFVIDMNERVGLPFPEIALDDSVVIR